MSTLGQIDICCFSSFLLPFVLCFLFFLISRSHLVMLFLFLQSDIISHTFVSFNEFFRYYYWNIYFISIILRDGYCSIVVNLLNKLLNLFRIVRFLLCCKRLDWLLQNVITYSTYSKISGLIFLNLHFKNSRTDLMYHINYQRFIQVPLLQMTYRYLQ